MDRLRKAKYMLKLSLHFSFLKVPYLYTFSDPYFSAASPKEKPFMINVPKDL